MATIFSGVMLGVMSDVSMDLVTNLGLADAVSSLTSIIANSQNPVGIMQTVTQQLGLGLLLSTLLITVPPMAGFWFNGVMGHYSGYNAMAGWNGGVPATPPGMNHYGQQVEQKANHHYQQISGTQNVNQNQSVFDKNMFNYGNQTNIPNGSQITDTLKPSNTQPPQSIRVRVPQVTKPKSEEEETK